MKNKKRFLIAFDMDGTLLKDKNKRISHQTKEYLKKLNNDGHIIILASGRPYSELLPYYNSIGLKTPLVCFNGLHCFNPNDKNFPEIKFTFKKEHALELIDKLLGTSIDNAFVETDNKVWMIKEDDEIISFMWPHKTQRNMIFGHFKDTLDEDPMTFITVNKGYNNPDYIEECVKKYPHTHVRFWFNKFYSELYFDGVSKAHCLEEIRKYYNIPIEDTIAFGDYHNDIEMINWSAHGVAMKNGIDELKKHAKHITHRDNNHNGIIKTLKQIIKEN